MPWIILLIAGIIHAQSFSASVIPAYLLSYIEIFTLAILFYYWLSSTSIKQVLMRTFVFTIGHFCAGIYWLFISMNTYGNLAPPLAAAAVFLLSAYLSIYPMLAAAIFRFFTPINRPSIFTVFLIAATWALGEWLRATIFTGFPWLTIAYAHVDGFLASWAPILGAYGVAFMAALCAALLALALYQRKNSSTQSEAPLKKASIPVIVALLAITIISSIGLHQLNWSHPTGTPISVRLVQGNINQHDKFNPANMLNSLMSHFELANLPPADTQHPPKVVIFPETIIPGYQSNLAPELWEHIRHEAEKLNADFFIGTPYLAKNPSDGSPYVANSILLINGQTDINRLYEQNGVPRYDKQHLVPFGEFIPYGFRWFVEAIGIPMGDFNRGEKRQQNFIVDNHVFAANICYEDVFGEELLPALYPHKVKFGDTENLNPGANILFNVSNLAWFGDSSALGQHLQMARMRAQETARPMLRATNTGATAHINANGDVVAILPYHSAGVLDVMVQGTEGLTLYSRLGNKGILIIIVGILLMALRRKVFDKYLALEVR